MWQKDRQLFRSLHRVPRSQPPFDIKNSADYATNELNRVPLYLRGQASYLPLHEKQAAAKKALDDFLIYEELEILQPWRRAFRMLNELPQLYIAV